MLRKKQSNRDPRPPQSMSSSQGLSSQHPSPAMEFALTPWDALRYAPRSQCRPRHDCVRCRRNHVLRRPHQRAYDCARLGDRRHVAPSRAAALPRRTNSHQYRGADPERRASVGSEPVYALGAQSGAALSRSLDRAGDRLRVTAGSRMGEAPAARSDAYLERAGSFFYLIVGTHALHAVVAIGFLLWAYLRLCRGSLKPEVFAATQVFWYFVVTLWPIIYLRVYL